MKKISTVTAIKNGMPLEEIERLGLLEPEDIKILKLFAEYRKTDRKLSFEKWLKDKEKDK